MIIDPAMQSSNCTNCGTEFIGHYCHNCGQKKIELKDRSVKAFVVHFVEEFFTFDSKFFRTIKYLLFKPGYLTHEYISGRFVRYVTPLKLYLFTSIVVFFIIIRIDPDTYTDMMYPQDKNDLLQEIIGESRESSGLSEAEFGEKFNAIINDLYTPGLFVIMFIFSVCLKMIYINKHIFYVEHLVFTLHFFSMVLILFTIAIILKELGIDIETIIFFIAPCIYLLFAIKTVYHRKWIYAVISSVIMSFIYWVLLSLWTFGIIGIALTKV